MTLDAGERLQIVDDTSELPRCVSNDMTCVCKCMSRLRCSLCARSKSPRFLELRPARGSGVSLEELVRHPLLSPRRSMTSSSSEGDTGSAAASISSSQSPPASPRSPSVPPLVVPLPLPSADGSPLRSPRGRSASVVSPEPSPRSPRSPRYRSRKHKEKEKREREKDRREKDKDKERTRKHRMSMRDLLSGAANPLKG